MFFYIYNQNQSKCRGVFPLHTIVFGGVALIWKVINGLDFSQLLIFGRWWEGGNIIYHPAATLLYEEGGQENFARLRN